VGHRGIAARCRWLRALIFGFDPIDRHFRSGDRVQPTKPWSGVRSVGRDLKPEENGILSDSKKMGLRLGSHAVNVDRKGPDRGKTNK